MAEHELSNPHPVTQPLNFEVSRMSTATADLRAWHFRFKRFTGDVRKDGTPEFTVTEYTAVAESRDKALAIAEASAANDNAGELLNDAPAQIGNVRGEVETDGSGKPVRIAGKPRCAMHASYSRDQWEAKAAE